MKGINQERLMVLNLLQEGKIDVDEATKLLESLSVTSENQQSHYESHEIEEKVQKFTKSVEQFAKEAGTKINSTYKACEPKVKSALKTAIEKTVDALNKASDSLSKSLENGESNEVDKTTAEMQINEDDVPKEN